MSNNSKTFYSPKKKQSQEWDNIPPGTDQTEQPDFDEMAGETEDSKGEVDSKIDREGKPIRKKSMNEDLQHEEQELVDETPQSDEPLGAQLLRRFHDDASTLLQEYDEIMPLLEHSHVKKHAIKHCQNLASFLDANEDLFNTHYKELPPLDEDQFEDEQSPDQVDEYDNAEPTPGEEAYDEEIENTEMPGAEMEDAEALADEALTSTEDGSGTDDEAIEADSYEPERPTPEEAFEGSKKPGRKNLPNGKVKAYFEIKPTRKYSSRQLSRRVRDVRNDEPENVGDYDTEPPETVRSVRSAEHENEKPYKVKPHRDYSNEGVPSGKPQPVLRSENLPQSRGEDVAQVRETPERHMWRVNVGKKGIFFQPHEQGHLKEAHSFLRELADTHEFGDEHRMKSFHFHKVLEPMGMIGTKGDNERTRQIVTSRESPDREFIIEELEGERDPHSENSEHARHRRYRSRVSSRFDVDPDVSNSSKSMIPGDLDWLNEEGQEEYHHRSLAGEASKYFKGLSVERAFGEPHRQQAFHLHEAMQPLIDLHESQNQEEESNEGEIEDNAEDSNTPMMNGDMQRVKPGEVDQKSIENSSLIQSQRIEALTKTLQDLATKF